MARMPMRPYRVCLVIPAGRQRYLQILIPHILRQQGWDELMLWSNTSVESDRAFLETLPAVDPRIRLVDPPEHPPDGSKTIGQFFRFCIDPQTVYIRLDDDICFLEEGLIEDLAAYRWSHPEFLLVTPCVINNAIISYILFAKGKLRLAEGVRLQAHCLDPFGWRSGPFAEQLHRLFLRCLEQGSLAQFKFDPMPIAVNRFSINCISWLGSRFASFAGRVPFGDEEEFLSVLLPTRLGLAHGIYGRRLAVHFAFYTQREHLEATDLLDRYTAIATASQA